MIFITLGTQKFQFNRVLEKLDRMVKENKITDKVFAQIGYSDYRPQCFDYTDFMDRETFKKHMENSEVVITHGGTGAIISALKAGKKVIAIPRLSAYKEHVDDHQTQIVDAFAEMELIKSCLDIEKLDKIYIDIQSCELRKYVSSTESLLGDIDGYLLEVLKEL